MEIVNQSVGAARRPAGRATAITLALVAALSGAFALGRTTAAVSTAVVAPRQAVVPAVVLEPPGTRPSSHRAAALDSRPRSIAVHPRPKWG